jgi:hypothetical protein
LAFYTLSTTRQRKFITLMVYNATIHTSHPNKYRAAAC